MPDYFYDMDLVVDPLNPSNVVAMGSVSIYDPADTAGTTLLALKDPSGLPLPNPLTSNANGFLPPRIAQVPQTLWKSGGFEGYFNSYKGLRDEAVSAVAAAQGAADAATTAVAEVVTTAAVDGAGALVLTKANGSTVNAGSVRGPQGIPGPQGQDGSNVLPTDTAIQQAITTPGTATATALSATILDAVSGLATDEWLLIHAIGQSNMAGRGTAFSTLLDPPCDMIYQFGYDSRTLSLATEPLDMNEASTSGMGPAFQFARWLIAKGLNGGRKIVIIPGARGGTQLSKNTSVTWKSTVSGSLLDQWRTLRTDAIAAIAAEGGTTRDIAALWVQGESDGDLNVTGATYQTDLDALIAAVRTTTGKPLLPFIVGQMVPEYLGTGTRLEINAVHANTPNRVAGTAFIPGPENMNNSDGNHYNAPGQRAIGKNMADAYELLTAGLPYTNAYSIPTIVTQFSDTFTRADSATMGTTEVGAKAWTLGGTNAAWGIIDNAAAPTGGTVPQAFVTAVADGVLTAKLKTPGAAPKGGILFRRSSSSSYLSLMLSLAAGTPAVYCFYKRVAGASTLVHQSAVVPTAGDVIEITLNGSSVGIKVNDVSIYNDTVTDQVTATGYGFDGNFTGSADTRWEEIKHVEL